MIKILHTGDWHLDSPFQGRTEEQAALLREAQRKLPGELAALCGREHCDLVLISGDLFDGACTQDTFRLVREALTQMAVPVFISPGNHDYFSPDSPYARELWPENVHIFTKDRIEYVDLPDLGLRVYGAGFRSMDCESLLVDFRAEGNAVGVFHADPTQLHSPYNPVTKTQVADSGLRYLALGHIHKADGFRAGDTLCAWPGCPMGRGWDEEGEKGVLMVELGDAVTARFVPLSGPRFFDLEVEAAKGVGAVLPALANDDFYRITLTGEAEKPDLAALRAAFAVFPNLELRDRTVPVVDIWKSVGEDSFEGVYFAMLRDALEAAPPEEKEKILLAAKLSRRLLEGQEVVLP